MIRHLRLIWLWFRGVVDQALLVDSGLPEVGEDTLEMLDQHQQEAADALQEFLNADPEECDYTHCSCGSYSYSSTTNEVKIPLQHVRRILWDMISCDEVRDYYRILDMPIESLEVSDMEHKASHRRIASVSPLFPILHKQCLVTSTVLLEGLKSRCEVEPENQRVMLTSNYQEHFSVVVALLGSLLEDGVIQITGPEEDHELVD